MKLLKHLKNIFGFLRKYSYNLKNKINNLFIRSSDLISKNHQKNYIIGNLPRIQIEYISIL